ncbi:MAG TPA: diacylglycerol kinase family protein [Streptosporangiaceae bacterium]|nr:diacylglycerol kinase family protein [Streptosporangiaceae bacterium]
MRALLIVNPYATSTTPVRREVITHALASELDLDVVQTRYRGHAAHVAEGAAREGFGLVLTLGGDGTVNEVVNGILRARPPAAGRAGAGPPGGGPDGAPLFAALPGGNANVFVRALGLPVDPVDATGRILRSLPTGRTRTIGLGLAGHRYFCFNAGLGFDAEVVRVVEGLRARGRAASAALYVWTAVRQFLTVTDRREPALTLERDGQPAMNGLYLGIVSNAAPWTYLGQRPVNASPSAGFDTGLDLFALRKLGTLRVLNAVRQMLGDGGPAGRHVVSLHDQDALSFRAARPVAFQVDGEYVGEREHVLLRSIPNALRVLV